MIHRSPLSKFFLLCFPTKKLLGTAKYWAWKKKRVLAPTFGRVETCSRSKASWKRLLHTEANEIKVLTRI